MHSHRIYTTYYRGLSGIPRMACFPRRDCWPRPGSCIRCCRPRRRDPRPAAAAAAAVACHRHQEEACPPVACCRPPSMPCCGGWPMACPAPRSCWPNWPVPCCPKPPCCWLSWLCCCCCRRPYIPPPVPTPLLHRTGWAGRCPRSCRPAAAAAAAAYLHQLCPSSHPPPPPCPRPRRIFSELLEHLRLFAGILLQQLQLRGCRCSWYSS